MDRQRHPRPVPGRRPRHLGRQPAAVQRDGAAVRQHDSQGVAVVPRREQRRRGPVYSAAQKRFQGHRGAAHPHPVRVHATGARCIVATGVERRAGDYRSARHLWDRRPRCGDLRGPRLQHAVLSARPDGRVRRGAKPGDAQRRSGQRVRRRRPVGERLRGAAGQPVVVLSGDLVLPDRSQAVPRRRVRGWGPLELGRHKLLYGPDSPAAQDVDWAAARRGCARGGVWRRRARLGANSGSVLRQPRRRLDCRHL
mmetsp:Transcript_2990/g.9033  ORF Transcript_2990/g.9033 Transcript_2990/m.9033 type:complete len:253 (+) Transcript_2990:692-1450(+)